MAWRPGIRIEIVFTLTVLMAGAMALVGILFLKIEERNLMEQKVREGKQMVGSLQRFLQEWQPEGWETFEGPHPSETLQRVVILFAQSQGLSHFSIVNREFRVIADSRPDQVGKNLRDEDMEKAIGFGKMFAHGTADDKSFSLIKKAPLQISAPLLSQGRTVGGIRAEIALDDLRGILVRSQTTVFLYIFLTAFLLIVVGSLLLSRVIIHPLKKLVQMSEKIAEGNLDPMGDPAGGDEVGRLFSSFNHMASRLREHRAEMQKYIQSLEKVNLELRRAQDEIIRSEKLASIGRLAAGVAHEVGNPTGAILGYLDLLAKGGLPEEDKKEVLQRAENEALRIRRIVRDLLDFSRPSPRVEEKVDINAVIVSALSLVSHQKKVWDQVLVIHEFQGDLPPWKGDPHQLQQVMVNLLLNAADALRSSDPAQERKEKKLRLATKALRIDEIPDFRESLSLRRKEDSPGMDYSLLRTRRGSSAFVPGEPLSVVRVEVEDNGPGIPPEMLSRIFEPFYSTKSPGEGTGLGLAICLRILESYGGRIHVQSEKGKGTLFTIFLPIFGDVHYPKHIPEPQRSLGQGDKE
jgi:signal transduction histidine kinase